MAKNFHIPIRMCVSCRERISQNELLRLRCLDGNLERFIGYGRSFYICKDCLSQEKKILRSMMRQCRTKDKNTILSRLKEIIADDRKS